MGKRELAPRVSGKIRPGIKILTGKAKENPKAVAIYQKGVEAGKSFEDIEDELTKACGDHRMLRPVNTPYFTVRRSDFAIPEVADIIMRRFVEVRPDIDETPRLYRFPVVFGSDEITRILDFRFQMFVASGLKFWSAESEDGQQRLCRTFAPIKKDESGKAIRLVAGRDVISRPENGGVCKPESCPEFQSGQCKMRGRILFYIPGIPGAGLIEIPTGSKNFGFGSEARLQEILHLGGTIPTLIDGKPVFWLTKRLHRGIPMIDYDTGKTTRTDQWIIEIEADLDMSRLRARNQPLLLQSEAANAAAVLTGLEAAVPQLPGSLPATERTVIPGGTRPVDGLPASGTQTTTQAPSGQGQKASTDPVKKLRRDLNALMQSAFVDSQRYAAHASGKWGANWSKTETSLNAAIDEIKAIEPIAQRIRTHVEALGIAPEAFDTYARNSYAEDWQWNAEMLPSIEEELMNAFSDRDGYVTSLMALVEAHA
jgi:hypothetical protein